MNKSSRFRLKWSQILGEEEYEPEEEAYLAADAAAPEGRKGGADRRGWGCGHREELMSAGACGTKNARRKEGDASGRGRERESGPAVSHRQRPHDGSRI
jgi:hypothetical protein